MTTQEERPKFRYPPGAEVSLLWDGEHWHGRLTVGKLEFTVQAKSYIHAGKKMAGAYYQATKAVAE